MSNEVPETFEDRGTPRGRIQPSDVDQVGTPMTEAPTPWMMLGCAIFVLVVVGLVVLVVRILF